MTKAMPASWARRSNQLSSLLVFRAAAGALAWSPPREPQATEDDLGLPQNFLRMAEELLSSLETGETEAITQNV